MGWLLSGGKVLPHLPMSAQYCIYILQATTKRKRSQALLVWSHLTMALRTEETIVIKKVLREWDSGKHSVIPSRMEAYKMKAVLLDDTV